ncbi:MAG: hypothetical protein D3905_09375 [Candidatus Electrothrix sp. AS4_5]|nr:hypothetical protein [Candidatus Electrothrix gigas]
MKKLDENGKVTEKRVSAIKEERLKVLQGNYYKPEFLNYIANNANTRDTCSDMASGCDSYYAGTG